MDFFHGPLMFGVGAVRCLEGPCELVGFSVVICFLFRPGFSCWCGSTAPGKHQSRRIDEAYASLKKSHP